MFHLAATKIEAERLRIVPFLNERLVDLILDDTSKHEDSILIEMIKYDHPVVLDLGLKIGFPILIENHKTIISQLIEKR